MFAPVSSGRRLAGGAGFLVVVGGIFLTSLAARADNEQEPARVRRTKEAADVPPAKAVSAVDGREVFERRWEPGEPSRHGGDGVGPVYNEVSCAACHHQGALGGSGAAAKNVDMIVPMVAADTAPGAAGSKPTAAEIRARAKAQRHHSREHLAKVFPTLVGQPSAVLHRFGPGRDFDDWKRKVLNRSRPAQGAPEPRDPILERAKDVDRRVEASNSSINRLPFAGPPPLSEVISHTPLMLVRSQRNTPALFGDGLIDRIPDQALYDVARKRNSRFPEVTGRVARLADGSAGRFGWKAQIGTLHEFVLTACAMELGLHVPGASQAALPTNPAYSPPGWDLDEAECVALANFVRDLPTPVQKLPDDAAEASKIHQGEALFDSVGCTACHTPTLGNVSGIYSDLLLHDMGPISAASGAYYGTTLVDIKPAAPSDEGTSGDVELPVLDISRSAPVKADQITKTTLKQRSKLIGALPAEWKTPPLWGVADSAPYMHDGRAATLEEAIAAHGGEAARSEKMYRALSAENRGKLIALLASLKAPSVDRMQAGK